MKTHQELRKMAAEFEAERMSFSGRDVVVGSKPDFAAANPNHPNNLIPVILDRAEVEAYKSEKARIASVGGPNPPSPIPVLDYSAWTYKARCPECEVAQVEVSLGGIEEEFTPTSPARCLRAGCGWSGTNGEVLRPCLKCGALLPGVVDGVCGSCRKRKRKKATRKKAGKG